MQDLPYSLSDARPASSSAADCRCNAEATYQRLFERALVGIYRMSPQGQCLWANAEMARIFGCNTPEALESPRFGSVSDRYAQPGRWREFQRRMETVGVVTDFESEICRSDGTLLWVSENALVVRDAAGTILFYEGTVHDVSARKRAEEELRQREEQMRAIFDAATVGMARIDLDGRLTHSNPAFQKMLGYAAGELKGIAFARLPHPDDPPANIQLQWDTQEGRRDGYQVEKCYCRRDGSPVWADLTMTLVRDSFGRPQFSIAVAEDITERRRTQHSILALNQHLERRIQSTAALHRIDRAIMSGDSLTATLGLVLEQARAQLGVDAVTALTCDPSTGDLEYAVGSGLHCSALGREPQAAGVGLAGQAARERKVVQVADHARMLEAFADDPAMAAEGFTCCWAVPLVAKGQLKGVLELFHRAPLEVDEGWEDCLSVLAGQAALAIDSAFMFRDVQRSNVEMMQAYEATIEGWSRALDMRDQETEGHSRRVTDLTERLARAAGLSEADLVPIRRGALLHDIGKMGVPDRILLKTDNLSPAEWRVMRRHPQDAYDMLSPIAFLRSALDIPLCHHEKWDGSGYPQGLSGEDIPLAARLFAVVDVWDALCSDRPYRARWPESKVLSYIQSQSGTHFDPEAVAVFLEVMTGSRNFSPIDCSSPEPAETDLLPLLRAA